MLEVLYAILPVFLIIACGMIVERWAFLPSTTAAALSIYVLRLALPVLLMQILAGANKADLARGGFWFALLTAQLVVYGLGYVGDLLFARRGQGPAVVTGVSCSCCNAAFLGLPIVANLLPGNQEALLIAGIATITPSVIMTIAQSHLEILEQQAKPDTNRSLWLVLGRAILLNPLLIGLVVGVGLCVSGIGLWPPIDRAARLIGVTSAPCVLLALGLDMRNKLRVAFRSPGKHKFARQVGVNLVKLVVHPLLAWALLAACGLGGMWLAVGVIMAGTASAVGAYVVAEVYHTIPEESALSVVLTNGLSLFTMSAFAYTFKLLGMI